MCGHDMNIVAPARHRLRVYVFEILRRLCFMFRNVISSELFIVEEIIVNK